MKIETFSETAFLSELRDHHRTLFFEKIKSYEHKIAPILRSQGYRKINMIERTVVFTFGEITFSRSRWRKGKLTKIPVDDYLGLKKYYRYSNELMYRIAKLATILPYRQVCRVIELDYDVLITKDTVLKAVKLAQKLLKEREHYRFLETEQTPKILPQLIYIEGDGVMVKSTKGDVKKNSDLAHFVLHTGSRPVGKNRFELENKYEVINTSHRKAKEELLDYLYNHFEITDDTVLVTNSDLGHGYSKKTFSEFREALRIKKHEHFWDAYHVTEKIKQFFRYYPTELEEKIFEAIQKHSKNLLVTVLDTCESLIFSEEELVRFFDFKSKLLNRFSFTKPAHLRGLPKNGIGVMESQHRKITYRMKHQGMYWSVSGADTMAKMIILERVDKLRELFFGSWREDFKRYKDLDIRASQLKSRKSHNNSGIRQYKLGNKTGKWQLKRL